MTKMSQINEAHSLYADLTRNIDAIKSVDDLIEKWQKNSPQGQKISTADNFSIQVSFVDKDGIVKNVLLNSVIFANTLEAENTKIKKLLQNMGYTNG